MTSLGYKGKVGLGHATLGFFNIVIAVYLLREC